MKTAVEWLFEQLDIVDSSISYEYFKQAKEMEKQQMIDFATKYDEYCHNSLIQNRHQSIKSAEQYYNETFKSE
jgi:hypothetical protein